MTRCVSKLVYDGCSQRDDRENRLRASVVVGGHGPSRTASLSASQRPAELSWASASLVIGHRGPPIFQPAEHDLDTVASIRVAALGASLAVSDGLSALFPTGMQARLPLSFDASPNRSASEPRYSRDPRAPRQSLAGCSAKCPCSDAIADLNGGDEAAKPAIVWAKMPLSLHL